MADTADVVVVGGGVSGTSIAYALAARGAKRVTLCEKGALASGASGRSSALVRMHYTNEWDARLAWASFPVFRDWPQVMGGERVFTRTGPKAPPAVQDRGGRGRGCLRARERLREPGRRRRRLPAPGPRAGGAGA